MARLAFLVLLAAALANVCTAVPALDDRVVAMMDPSKWTYTDCGHPTDKAHIKTIDVSPDPPVPGQDLTVTVTGTVDEQIEEGAYADVLVKIGVIKLLQKEFDVCEEARNANATIQCPVPEGDHKISHTVALPREIPKASFVVNIRGYTVEDEDMLCLDLKIDFRKPRSMLFW